MSEPMPLNAPLTEMPRCDSRAGAGRYEWVVVFADGRRQRMFGGRFFIPPDSKVVAIIRRDFAERGEAMLKDLGGKR